MICLWEEIMFLLLSDMRVEMRNVVILACLGGRNHVCVACNE